MKHLIFILNTIILVTGRLPANVDHYVDVQLNAKSSQLRYLTTRDHKFKVGKEGYLQLNPGTINGLSSLTRTTPTVTVQPNEWVQERLTRFTVTFRDLSTRHRGFITNGHPIPVEFSGHIHSGHAEIEIVQREDPSKLYVRLTSKYGFNGVTVTSNKNRYSDRYEANFVNDSKSMYENVVKYDILRAILDFFQDAFHSDNRL